MQGAQEGDAEVIRHDRALEPPRLAQQPGEQLPVGSRRDSVNVGVGAHHAARAGLEHGHLERQRHHVRELARPHRDRREVAPGLRRRVADEMLERRDDARALEPADVRRGNRADQVGILADRLLDPAPARVANDVEHRREPLMHADGAQAAPDPRRHLLDQWGIEGRTPGERHRIRRRPPRGKAGETLLVRHRGDAVPVGLDDPPLRARQRDDANGGIDRRRAEWPRQLTQAVLDQRVEIDALGELVLKRRHITAHGRDTDPDSVQLRELLTHGHHRDQRLDPLGRCQRRVIPRRDGAALCRSCGHHFPPTPIRPWIRARRANR